MYRVISLCALIAISSCALSRSPYPHYLPQDQYEADLNFTDCFDSTDGDNIYRYSIPHLNTSLPNITFSEFKGKVILIVNVATYCRSTTEYPQLNQLKEEFGDQLVIVAVPSNNFLNQEPTSSAEEIYNGIKYVRPGNGFVPKFPLTQRVDVNGEKTHPIFSYLKRSCPATRTRFVPKEQLLYEPKHSRDIRWNFEKFLIDPSSGKPVRRYDEVYGPIHIAKDIRQLTNNSVVFLFNSS